MLLAQDASSQRINGAPTRIYCLNLCCICIAYNSVMVCACCVHIPCIWRYSNKNTEFVMWCDVQRWHTVFAQICVMMVDPGQAQFNSRCHFRETSHRMIYVSRANAFCTERTRNAAIRSCPSQKPGATKKRFRGGHLYIFLAICIMQFNQSHKSKLSIINQKPVWIRITGKCETIIAFINYGVWISYALNLDQCFIFW